MNLNDVYEKLTAPFPAGDIKLKPQSVKDGRALALCYIDARDVLNRLDQVVGPAGWSDEYRVVNESAVICRLTLLGVTKEGIGQAGGTPGEETLKSAESDALKRAAVKFGVGRYLYAMPKRWLGFDGRKFTEPYPFPVASGNGKIRSLVRGPIPPAVCEEAFEPFA